VGEDRIAGPAEIVVRPTTPLTRRGRVASAVATVFAIAVFVWLGAWQQRTHDRTPGRNTFDKGMRPVTYGDTPCAIGRLRVDWRAVSTRRCQGDRWVLVRWADVERLVIEGRQLAPGYGWVTAIGLGAGSNYIEGERMERYIASYAWTSTSGASGQHKLTIAIRTEVLSSSEIEARSLRRDADRRWRVGDGFAVDTGDVTIDLAHATIRVAGPDRISVAEFMARQYQ
jgi:hypothetical protein